MHSHSNLHQSNGAPRANKRRAGAPDRPPRQKPQEPPHLSDVMEDPPASVDACMEMEWMLEEEH